METGSHYEADYETAAELVHTAENSVVAGLGEVNGLVRLYPKWKFSREQIVKFVKSCRYCLLRWNNESKQVFWIGGKRNVFMRMLTDQDWSTERSEETLDIEEEVFQMRRTAFLECAFFSPNDLMLFQLREDAERRVEGGFIVNWNYFTWWSAIHRDFISINSDLLKLNLNQKCPTANFTVRELLFNFLMIRTDNLVNA